MEDGGKGVWGVGGTRVTVQTQGREGREIGKGGGGAEYIIKFVCE